MKTNNTKTPKMTFIKKVATMSIVFVMLIGSTAFISNNKTVTNEDEFIYLYAVPKKPNVDKLYFSNILRFTGYSSCGMGNTTFFAKAGAAFKKHLIDENNIKDFEYNWRIVSVGKQGGHSSDVTGGYFKGFDNVSDAEKSKNGFIQEIKYEGRHFANEGIAFKIFETYFSYECN